MMSELRDQHGMTFVFSTHDPRVVSHAVRVVTLVDGRVAHDEEKPGEAPHEILPGVGKA
jgi:putative ABC transport system ATP-binding protein